MNNRLSLFHNRERSVPKIETVTEMAAFIAAILEAARIDRPPLRR
jgi:hypothetical protein